MNPTEFQYLTDGYVVTAQLIYMTITVLMTVWVARTLQRHGEVFLIDAFEGDAALAGAVNRLLVVGFYLVNVGFVLMRTTEMNAGTVASLVRHYAGQIGSVLMLLGAMHFLNVYVFNRYRSAARNERRWAHTPPVPPTRVPGEG